MLDMELVNEYTKVEEINKRFAKKPTWTFRGIERVVKIGYKYFNYIDYLEAWCGLDCHTYRKQSSLKKLQKSIKEAFQEKEITSKK